jgi:fructose-bisphosphate aldolase class I
MVISGKKNDRRANARQVAEATMRALKRYVPGAVPGIAFFSGGQSAAEASEHLSVMNKPGPLPWALTFSYGRALQHEALKAWGGKPEGFTAGQKAFARRAKFNGLATTGAYTTKHEQEAA